ncbi:MAG: Crp/Fnr family transcriptional regulator [Paludibacter sp.]|nr:Crp/Fnr family transcriptional regulator [Paludibacter sp.]
MQNDCRNCPFKTKATSKLSECSLDQLTSNHLELKLKKGDSIIKQGTYSTNVIFLRTGLAKIHLEGPYNEQIVKLVNAPSYLGLPTTFGSKINQYSVTAVSEVEVCFIDLEVFQNILDENREFTREIIREFCKNELESFHRCANRTQKLIRGNMADALLEFSDNIFKSDIFLLPLSQGEFANLIDTSRESVSRVLTEFDKDGIIKITGKQIEIVNKKSLQLISQNG